MSGTESPEELPKSVAPYGGLEFVRFTEQGWPVVRTGKMVPLDGRMIAQETVWFEGDIPHANRADIRPMPDLCTIYFIGPAEGPIKIGFASRLDFRVRDLRLANAYPLEIWATIDGPPSIERAYHQRFAAHRLHGEWFDRHPDILAEIDRLNCGSNPGLRFGVGR